MNIFWFRRDLRLDDNHALFESLKSGDTLPIFIFDEDILSELPKDDSRVTFIYDTLKSIHETLEKIGSSLEIYHGKPINVWKSIIESKQPEAVYINKDYEPYALNRDLTISNLLKAFDIPLYTFKDQVIFEANEVLKADGKPYTIYTPYMRKWMHNLQKLNHYPSQSHFEKFIKNKISFPSLNDIGFEPSSIKVLPFSFEGMEAYNATRDYPSLDQTTHLSVHLRFGTISVRNAFLAAQSKSETLTKELIWREFFMQILLHFPNVQAHNFKRKYDKIAWRNNEQEFEQWCQGKTGYPIVDAGMRQLNDTGYMHNRVRMITAGFLCKHLLIDWRWGEAYFAEKLLDYDLSANNGNWQWAAGTGCDAAPYFRIFNPTEQVKKFDKELKYINKWVKEYNSLEYPTPMVEHKFARQRALDAYKIALN